VEHNRREIRSLQSWIESVAGDQACGLTLANPPAPTPSEQSVQTRKQGVTSLLATLAFASSCRTNNWLELAKLLLQRSEMMKSRADGLALQPPGTSELRELCSELGSELHALVRDKLFQLPPIVDESTPSSSDSEGSN